MQILHGGKLPVVTIGFAIALIGVSTDSLAQRGGRQSADEYNNPECDLTVTGVNQSPNDANAVNIAVNAPLGTTSRTVCLEGTFRFGDRNAPIQDMDSVTISPSDDIENLRITGLEGATIWYGSQPLRVGPTSGPERLTIDHIRFIEPSVTAITVFSGNELVRISDNVVDGVKSLLVPALGLTLREGIVVTSAYADINGSVIISDNWVDAGGYGGVDDATIAVSAGIGVFGGIVVNSFSINADVEVSGNGVRNWSGSGIYLNAVDGNSLTEHNLVAPGYFANDVPDQCVANGIEIRGMSEAIVRGNTIEVVPAKTALGDIPDCTAAILLAQTVGSDRSSSDNVIRNNQIRGTGQFGIVVSGDASAPSEDNLFIGNLLSRFDAGIADVSFDMFANFNTYRGNYDSAIDEGTGNSLSGSPTP